MSISVKIMPQAMVLAAMLLSANTALAETHSTTPAPAATSQAQPASVEANFNRWDKDQNKSLSLDEFKAGWQEVQATMVLRKLHDTFATMDANKSNSLEAAEYANLELVKRAGKSAPLMSAFDTDKNQGLSFKEYVAMIGAMRKNQR